MLPEATMQTSTMLPDNQAMIRSIGIAIENATLSGDHATAAALSAILRCINNRGPDMQPSKSPGLFG
jgi:hypothetical protein